MPVELPEVTLIAIDSVAHYLTRLAIEDTLREIEPAEVLIWSNMAATSLLNRGAWLIGADLHSFDDVARVLWREVPRRVKTSHFLIIQYDGWVLDGTAWRPEWLECDYIGAPWWYRDGHNVGNGGFSLRSTALARYVAAHDFPALHPEDETLCRRYRPALEAEGFVWASEREAGRFSFERALPRPTFGFHGMWHWPRVLGRDRFRQRSELATDYVRAKPEWHEMMACARGVLAA